MDNHNKKYENDLTEISMQKDEADRRLLMAEVLFVSVITVFFLILVFVACFLLQTFTTMSSSLAFSPTIIPS